MSDDSSREDVECSNAKMANIEKVSIENPVPDEKIKERVKES